MAKTELRPRAVAFDLDGLLFNTEELYQQVGGELLARRGREWTPELLDAMMGRPGRVSLAIMIEWHGLEDTVDALAAESDALFDDILQRHLAPMPGVVELLDRLEAAQLPKGIATSSGRAFVERVLGLSQLDQRFDFALTAEDVVEGKPHPEIYQKAAARFGVQSGEMLVLEDSQNGCRAAHAAGAMVVAVPGDHSRHHDFSGAHFIADTLRDPRLYEVLGLRR